MVILDVIFDDVEYETEKAYLLNIDGEKYWIPKSQVEDLDEELKIITLPEWLINEKGLDMYIAE